MAVERVSPQQWVDVMSARYDDGFTVLETLAAVDAHDGAEPVGLDVVAILFDPRPGAIRRHQVWTRVPDEDRLESLASIWPGARWLERAAADLSGLLVGSGLVDREPLLVQGTPGEAPPLSKKRFLPARIATPWPGSLEPGERRNVGSGPDPSSGRRNRRRLVPPGVPPEQHR
ncbi:NAD(P)H-quinone oxidoreductase subunit J, chloroplastic [Austwickia sp. TVS 96-490-7B]|nr:NAD(P)H-quinone oxidoreductase subunit J, chloroplastic [Austwickia sp. TVS 96-490-7B]